jgi:hypothetical protein
MKKRLRKKIITACFDKLPIELYKEFLYKKCKYNVVSSYHNLIKKGKKDGYKAYVSITGPEGTVYKKFKK